MDRPLIFSVWLGKVFYLTKICHQIFTENNYLTDVFHYGETWMNLFYLEHATLPAPIIQIAPNSSLQWFFMRVCC